MAQGNYMDGRSGNPISLIVDHWVGVGTLESAERRFKTPGQQASAHFGIGQDGRIWQWVALEDTAYHCGQFQANMLSIGIEHEATTTLLPSKALYDSSAWLHRHLSQQYGIQLEVGRTVRPHNYFSPTQCPGTLDLQRIVKEATMAHSPQRIGQSADLTLQNGQVGQITGIWHYVAVPGLTTANGNRSVTRKVVGYRPGRFIHYFYPPVDPDADPTEDVGAEPAIFVVDVAG